MLTALIVAIIINVLMMALVLISLSDIRLRVVAVGIGMQIIAGVLQRRDEPIMEARKSKEQNESGQMG
jgi:hypothetical protein